jgi:hypothetical protein
MRLGAQPVRIERGTLAYKLYGTEEISERHRHRYEVNPRYIRDLEAAGLKFSGKSLDGRRMEIPNRGRRSRARSFSAWCKHVSRGASPWSGADRWEHRGALLALVVGLSSVAGDERLSRFCTFS